MSKKYVQATERIYRGVVAKPHSWPWIAKLKVTLKMIFVFLVVSPVFCEHCGIWLGLLYMHDDLAMQFQWIWHFLSKSFSHLAVVHTGKSFFLFFAHHRGCIPKLPCNLVKHISLIHYQLFLLSICNLFFSLFLNWWKEKVLNIIKSYSTFLCRCWRCQM